MLNYPIAIIGGTGVKALPFDTDPETVTISTRYGDARATLGTLRGKPLAFLARHGAGHKLPPHKINYRANIAALVGLGVRAVLATTAVGAMRLDLSPGDFVLLDDFIDFTRDREHKTFFDGENGLVVHTDFTRPYSDAVRAVVIEAAAALGTPLRPTGTYLAGDGPRYETPAEVRLFAQWGADVAGMTGVPEATLAREAGLHYAGISLVTNPGAGLSPSPLTHEEVVKAMETASPVLRALLAETVARLDVGVLPPIASRVPFSDSAK
ncbi:MAG: S-methyl-5'-thioinosine phosphorylase [Armatimonadetes bacterium]|nr:S-methyl-5'-thioinosine phosphorylase [Armatimonadota bacterium]